MSSTPLHASMRSSRERTAVAWAALGALLLLAWIGISPSAGAQTYALVKSADDIPPYELAIENLRKVAGGDAIVGSLETDPSRWEKVRDKLIKKSPAIWVPVGKLALKQAASVDAPIVFVMVTTPERSLPGGAADNVCGVTTRLSAEVKLSEINAMLPKAKQLGVLYDPTNAVSAREIKQARAAAGAHAMTILEGKMSDPSELASKLDELLGAGIDALWLILDRTVTPPRNADAFKYIAETTAKARVPVIGYAEKLTKDGALFSLGTDYADMGAQAGEMVKKIAAGASPSELGIESARKVSLSVNTRVASALGIGLPPEALGRATATFD